MSRGRLARIVGVFALSNEVPRRNAVVLCVDDDPWLLGMTTWLLEQNGFDVLTATDGREALEVFTGSAVDLVVVDGEMRGKEGHEIATVMKAMDPRVPVVLQSGAVDLPAVLARATDAILPKGSDMRLLPKVVAKLTDNGRKNGSNGHS
jgi:two-component system, OmpR family, response regulator VicR